jgi:tRNA pseudouridine13 synthase
LSSFQARGSEYSNSIQPAIRCIKTEDEAKAFTIFDVVLPLPGYAIEYPSNSIGELYQALLNEEGWDPRDKRNGAERELALPGDYRCIMAVPKNLEWKLYRYNDEMQPLSQTDLDIMNSHPEPANVEGIIRTNIHTYIRI